MNHQLDQAAMEQEIEHYAMYNSDYAMDNSDFAMDSSDYAMDNSDYVMDNSDYVMTLFTNKTTKGKTTKL